MTAEIATGSDMRWWLKGVKIKRGEEMN